MGHLELLVAALAVWEVVEVWHHSELTATWRARAEELRGWRRTLLTCPFCMSPWAAAVVLALLWSEFPGFTPGATGVWRVMDLLLVCTCVLLLILAKWAVYSLATARLANVASDLTHRWCRTPGAGPGI
jgi:hypothetical protein